MLSITDLSIRLAGRLLIDQSSVQITPGSRVGMVGRNGTGKSTLFKVIRGELAAEHGTVSLPPRWRVGSLAQEAPNGPESLISVVLKADLERDALLTEAESATDPHQIAEIQTRLVDIDAHSAPSRAAAILSGLGFSAADQLRPCAEFSGGWRMRVALAATLFAAPDLLLLDEPTNYLDLEGTLWLEDHLAHYPRTVIVISHDRDLLESSVDQILHLDRSKLTLYKGTYSSFEEQRAMREMLDAKAVKRQEAERARLQAFVDRFKAKASKARQAQSRVKMLERLKPITALVTQDVREISFPAPEKILSPPIIAADNVVVGYDPTTPVLNRVTLRVDNDDRIALLGSNGNGKSTLVKLLAGRLAPFSGKVTRADKLSIAYFAQHQLDELNEDASTYDHVRKLMGEAPEAKVRARAGAIGFSGKAADTKVGKLSGGEKARLLLGLATFFGPNMIILDEPTNHLDIDSRAALAEAINEFPGAVIMVSHDRYLIESCADQLWIVADRTVTNYDGDLDEYRRLVLSARNGEPAPRERNAPSEKPQRPRSDNRGSLKKRIAEAETEIARVSAIISKIDTALALPDIFTRDPKQAAQLSKARANAADALARAEEQWLEASTQFDEAAG
ncbi:MULTISPECIES: ABC-F family ATP-binding cassette domain-containing protein [Bradyrhizobium]|jgi:ATP-binding cassette subfamily F protein 3|uniref:ABC-F family ATP-binding cassette domain-containing protein n=1 Tax=Bradyrhizobium TaxID=374 RepID=UPI00036B3349|nr:MULTISPECIES: ABC-F family ATP-binding cassette domain-containing protein [Bradyrhizobium]MBM7482180.1 ATP-binding cassette subfamily F protein 3 [Bradyrhizobium canariense]MCK1273317.1 ABC-F family ATP-binding cassette domain-containing protein [Bradyrhizobium sp. 84]MCK1323410.1 ABC-F family ATP-binding cassette domain-containing protein [Bradyrhizobium sp. 156]MCK1328671.1 ABC-F family ATP-binding cassette domain-containing protein [Bradyrhizobium sp. CW9]MCK1350964.1 ABC-F family ATP-bi